MSSEGLDRLFRGVSNCGGVQVAHFFRDHFQFYPGGDEKRAFLGEGGFGKVYTVKSATDRQASIKVCKVMSMSKISQDANEIRHVCAELAILTKISPHCHQLNRARAVFHDDRYLYMVLDMTEAGTPDLATRLYSLIATYRPQSIPEVEILIERIHAAWEKKLPTYAEHFAKNYCIDGDDADPQELERYLAGKKTHYQNEQLLSVMTKLKAPAEEGNRMDLFDIIAKSKKKRLSEAKAAVIIKQCLKGVEYLHQCAMVHLDIKTENVVVGITKIATPKRDENGNVIGVTFREKIDAQVIDFGLAKHTRPNGTNVAQTPTLNMFGIGSSGAPVVKAPVASGGGGGGGGMGLPPVGGGMGLPGGMGLSGAPPPVVKASAGTSNPFDNMVVPAKTESTVAPNYRVTCTPWAGTHVFTALEGLLGWHGAGTKGHWVSTAQDLPKLDIYGCGTMLYQMTHGFKPFRAPPTARSNRDKLAALIELIKAGPQVQQGLTTPTKRLIETLLSNNVKKRPTATDVLNDAYFLNVTDTYTYTVDLNGNETEEEFTVAAPLVPTPPPMPRPPNNAKPPGRGSVCGIENMTKEMVATHSPEVVESKMDPKNQDQINEALREMEDDGDSQGKRAAKEEEK